MIVGGPTWLFTPADRRHMLERAVRSAASAVIADLEDAVAETQKPQARQCAVEFASSENGAPLRVVRINDPRGETGRLDLAALARSGRPTVMVPKASRAGVEIASQAGLSVVALVETAEGLATVEELAMLPGVEALAIGTVDLATELGLSSLPDGLELLYARSRVVLAGALAGIPVIDGIHLDVTDGQGLEAAAVRARALGFAGMLCIHPRQLDVVADRFRPSQEELERSRRIVAAYESSLEKGLGATALEGGMVDLATVRRAERLLAQASPSRVDQSAMPVEPSERKASTASAKASGASSTT